MKACKLGQLWPNQKMRVLWVGIETQISNCNKIMKINELRKSHQEVIKGHMKSSWQKYEVKWSILLFLNLVTKWTYWNFLGENLWQSPLEEAAIFQFYSLAPYTLASCLGMINKIYTNFIFLKELFLVTFGFFKFGSAQLTHSIRWVNLKPW